MTTRRSLVGVILLVEETIKREKKKKDAQSLVNVTV